MSLVGLNPKNELGKSVRFSVWSWHPIWEYVEINYPDISNSIPNGHMNDGFVLSPDNGNRLAKLLENDLTNGKIENYIKELNNLLDTLPETLCHFCLGSGYKRKGLMSVTDDLCTICNGRKISKPMAYQYKTEIAMFFKFYIFVNNSNGFAIT